MTDFGKNVYLIGNWKSNKTFNDAITFFDDVHLPELPSHVSIGICPPTPYLLPISEYLKQKSSSIHLGIQDISPYPFGAYTGAVSAAMVQNICRYCIVGHSERRKYFHETNEEIAQKVRHVLDAHMTPVVCVDEPYIESQLAFFETDELTRMIIAYEPLAAIGSGLPDTPIHANQVAQKIIQVARVSLPVLYGGSVTAVTVKSFLDKDNIQGVLVGAASLDAASWSALVSQAVL